MLRLRYNDKGQVSGLPDAICPGDATVVEVFAEDESVDAATANSLKLALETPQVIATGLLTFGFGASSATIRAAECSAFALHTLFSRMDSIVSAGGATVTGDNGIFTLAFSVAGSRTTPTVSHSVLGALNGRVRTVIDHSPSHKAVFEIDLTIQTLAEDTTGTNLSAATATVTNVATGNASTAQRDKIVISRAPDRGKFQIWTSTDIATAWLKPDAPPYQIQAALDDVEPGEFLTDKQVIGEEVTIDIRRAYVGTNAAPTVVNTFIGPDGLGYTLDTEKVRSLLAIIGGRVKTARLTFVYGGATKFSELVELSPLLYDQGQVI